MRRLFGWFKKKTDPIKVGVVTSRSGPLMHWGSLALQGLELGVEYATGGSGEVWGRPIEFLVEDDAGEPDIGAEKARRLIEQEEVHLLAGCVSSAIAIQVSKIAEERQRVFFVDPAATDVLTGEWFNRFVFRAAPNVSQDAATAGEYAVENLGRTFCFLSPDYVLGHQSRSAWWRSVEEHGGEVVGDILAPPTESNFRSYLEQALATEAEVLMPTWAGSGLKNLFAQMRELGVFEKMRILSNLVDRESLRILGTTAEGVVGAARYHWEIPRNSVNDWLISRCQARYGEPPDVFTGIACATGIALVEGLRRTEGDPDAEALIPALEGMRFEGPKGPYTFRPEDHQALQQMYIVEMVRHPEESHCIPRLIREVSQEDSAPPLIEPEHS